MALKDAQARLSANGKIYLYFSSTHPVDGSLSFYLCDHALMTSASSDDPNSLSVIIFGGVVMSAGDATGDVKTVRVYPVVKSWAPLRAYLAQDGDDRESEFTIDLFALSWCVPSNGTTRYRIVDLLRSLQNLHDSKIVFYQWNKTETPEAVFTGYWRGVDRMEHDGQEMIASIKIAARPSTVDLVVGEVVDVATYPKAPADSMGRMVARAYGDYTCEFDAVGTALNLPPVAFGYGQAFVPGIDVDDSATGFYASFRFCKNDGVSAAGQAFSADTDKPNGNFWIFVPETGSYASIYGTDVSQTNDSNSVRANVKRTSLALACFRPTEIGTTISSALADSAYKCIDDDATNYIDTTSTDYVIAFKCPIVSNLGGRVFDLRVAVDSYSSDGSNRTADFGLWDLVSGGWLASKKQTDSTGLQRNQIVTTPANAYTATDPSSTRAEFSEGRFVTRDANGLEKPLEIRIEVTSATKSGYRLLSVALVCKVELPSKVIETKHIMGGKNPNYRPPTIENPFGNGPRYFLPRAYESVIPADSVAGTQFLFGGICQKDDALGTVTGAAGAIIKKAADVAHHLLRVVGGYAVNSTAGTMGSFVDAAVEAVAKETQIRCFFGLDEMSRNQVIKELQRRWPMRLSETGGVWNLILDEMNPASTRLYRSVAEPIRISARRDLSPDGFHISQIPVNEISNNVQLNYSHAYGTNKSMGTATYSNPLSSESFYYGLKPLRTIDESWIPRNDLVNENPHPAASYLAKWYGRRSARPRLTVRCRLGQAFYDLQRGRVLEFDSDMEDVGIQCPAYRCGWLEYAYIDASDTVNYANSAAPKYVKLGLTSGRMVFGVSQLVASLTAYVQTATDNDPFIWRYFNGSSWVALTGVVNGLWCKQTGVQTVSFDRPSIDVWPKVEMTLGGVMKGPCYFFGADYYSVARSSQGLGYARTDYPAKWIGRVFEVIEATRRSGSVGDYPYMDAVLQEVM